jgi:hypothetical protein
MRDRELTALTTLGFDELARATGGIGQIQQAVSARVFRAVGPGAALVRPVHEAVTRGVYAGLGAGTRTLGCDELARATGGIGHSRRRRAARAADDGQGGRRAGRARS